MNPPVETELPRISKIDTDALETADTTGVGIRFENGAKVQVVEDEGGSVEKQWHGPDHLGEPDGTRVVDDATDPREDRSEDVPLNPPEAGDEE